MNRINPYSLATWNRGEDEQRQAEREADGGAPGVGAGSGVEGQGARASVRDGQGGENRAGSGLGYGSKSEAGAPSGYGSGSGGDDFGGGSGSDEGAAYGLEDQIQVDPNARPRDFARAEEFARRTLFQARATAKKNGYYPRKTRIKGGKGSGFADRDNRAGYSGSGPDARDPQKMSSVLEKMLVNLGWDRGLSAGRVLAEWDSIVGPKIAEHSQIVSFDDGVLVVSADSSAWASQLRMLSPQIISAVHEHVGSSVVSELRVAGPAAKSWKKGKRTVTWRGPRDTYG